MRRRFALLAVLLVAFAGGVPSAAGQGQDNAAVAINTRDGSAVFRFAFKVRRAMGDVVDATNAAVAYSSCTDCQTTAIAIEIVLVMDNASVITPTNIAFAFNQDCTLCVTVADAYQFVLSTGGVVHFTAEGNQMLAQIKRELEALRHQSLTPDELQAKLDSIAKEIGVVLTTQLEPVGPPPSTPTPTTTTSPTTSEATTTGATTTTQPTTTETTETTTTTSPTTTGTTTGL